MIFVNISTTIQNSFETNTLRRMLTDERCIVLLLPALAAVVSGESGEVSGASGVVSGSGVLVVEVLDVGVGVVVSGVEVGEDVGVVLVLGSGSGSG